MADYPALWRATNLVGDYFSRLGGAGRYAGMYESEIFLFVACRTLDIVEGTDYVSRFVSAQFLAAAAAVIPAANLELEILQQQPADIHNIILEYVLYYDARLNNERCCCWNAFCEEISRTSVPRGSSQ